MKTIPFILCSILLTASSKAWDPPIGIPAPNWGATIGNPIETVAPTPPPGWTSGTPSEVTGYYYVAPSEANASDGNTYGRPGAPRASIPRPAPAGSIVFINGLYNVDHESWYLLANGTSTNPVWFLSYDHSSPATCTGSWDVATASSYLIIDNIIWDWSTTLNGGHIGFASCDHVCLRNGSTMGKATETSTSGASAMHKTSSGGGGYGVADQLEDLVIYNMNFKKGGNWLYTEGDPDAHGTSIGRWTKNLWIVDCQYSYFSGCAIQIGAGTIQSEPDTNLITNVYIGRCVAHHTAQTAFWAKRSQHCVFSQNTAYTMRRDCPSSPNSGGFGAQYGPRDCWFIYNTVYDCQNGIAIAGGVGAATGPSTDTDIYFIGNLIYNIHNTNPITPNWRGDGNTGAGTAILLRGGLNHHILNNTIHDYDAGIECALGGYARFIEGNILSGRNGNVPGADVVLDVDAGGANTFKYNIIEQIGGACFVKSGNSIYTTVAALNAAKGPGNSKTAPTYVNAAAGRFDLAVGSNGIDNFGSSAPPVYGLFNTAYSKSIAFDHAGTPRPQNGMWDIGAFEFSSGGNTNNPLPVIAVEQPPGSGLTSGAGFVSFGSSTVGKAVPLTFTIRNTGTAILTGIAVTKDGSNSTDFAFTSSPAADVAAGGTTTFTVSFTPPATGARSAALHIASNDAAHNPFDIAVTGAGTATLPAPNSPKVDFPK